MVWNRTRRQITRDLDTKLMNFREELLNRLLTGAWERYSAALETGTLVQLEDEASQWVDELLAKQLRPAIEADFGDVANS